MKEGIKKLKIFSILFAIIMLVGCGQQAQDNPSSTVSSGNAITQNLQQEKNYCVEYKEEVKKINLQINLLQNVKKFDTPDNLAKVYLNQKIPGKVLEQCIAEAFYIDGTSGHIVFTISEVDDGQIYISIQDASAYIELIEAEEFLKKLQDKQKKEEAKEEKQEQIPEAKAELEADYEQH